MSISSEIIEKIKHAANIEEVVGTRVSLHRRGSNLWGLCPFHSEKTPSFSVSIQKGIFKCFGCGKGGDAIHFLMEIDRISYVEALEALAERYHIPISYTDKEGKLSTSRSAKEKWKQILNHVQIYYSKALESAPLAQDYLKKRNISPSLVRDFRLGYAQEFKDDLVRHARTKGYPSQDLLDTGLVLERDGQFHDRFHGGRLIFPLQDPLGQVLGFAARRIKENSSLAKYVNSPETKLYKKGYYLYGLHQAKTFMHQEQCVYLVEGYMDLLRLHQMGKKHCLACGGTAFSIAQARLVKRYAQKLILFFDGDEAGIKATLQAGDQLLRADMEVQVVLLPKDEDPDSFFQKHGAEKGFQEIAQRTYDFFTAKWKILEKQHQHSSSSNPLSQKTQIKELLNSLELITDPVYKELGIKVCAELSKLEPHFIERYLSENTLDIPNVNQKIPSIISKKEVKNRPELEFIAMMLCYGECSLRDSRHEKIKEYDLLVDLALEEFEGFPFSDDTYKSILEALREQRKAGKSSREDDFLPTLKPEEQKVAKKILAEYSNSYSLSKNWREKHSISIPTNEEIAVHQAEKWILRIKHSLLEQLLEEKEKELKHLDNIQTEKTSLQEKQQHNLMKEYIQLKGQHTELCERLGRVSAIPSR
ncbi:MAG: DNA primase [Cytophagales bacterium]|nr:DNA primase [Cytophagales bacterium]